LPISRTQIITEPQEIAYKWTYIFGTERRIMQIRKMERKDLEMVLGWARNEGWNPGLEDAAAFYAADPEGFLLGEKDGRPVASISVVNHDEDNAFLGLYICRPQARGQGYGMALWTEALRHAGARTVGLDGVADQQANYARSGFVLQDETVRFKGNTSRSQAARLATDSDLQWLIGMDRRMVGHRRDRFANAWFRQSDTRRTVILGDASMPRGYVTFRKCDQGIKAGPLCAQTQSDAQMLLEAVPSSWTAAPVFFDTPKGSPMAKLLSARGFRPIFETARMMRGAVPKIHPPVFACAATLELG
jgi:GNAT superfamily N-acetyltransferase